MKKKLQEGLLGEELAAQYLKKHGYTILQRNFKIRYGEIDIVAIEPSTSSGKNSILVFIEVKTRSSTEYGTPLEAITYFKLRSVIKTAEYFVLKYPKLPKQLRIDAISVQLNADGSVADIEHVKNISM